MAGRPQGALRRRKLLPFNLAGAFGAVGGGGDGTPRRGPPADVPVRSSRFGPDTLFRGALSERSRIPPRGGAGGAARVATGPFLPSAGRWYPPFEVAAKI